MEWAIRPGPQLGAGAAAPHPLGEAGSYQRLYFGAEFCERRIPNRRQLEAALEHAAREGLALSYLTPSVTNAGLERVLEQLRIVADWGPAEVILGDYGVLRRLRADFPALTPVIGRLLVNPGDKELPSTARGDAPSGTASTRLLARAGVRAVEIDHLAALGAFPAGTAFHFHFPLRFLATGRVCLIGAVGQPNARRFLPGVECRRECEGLSLVMRDRLRPAQHYDQRGNTVFARSGTATLRTLLADAAEIGIRRLVYEPRPGAAS